MAVVGLPFKKMYYYPFQNKNSSDIKLQSSKKEKGREMILDMSGLQYIYLKIHKI